MAQLLIKGTKVAEVVGDTTSLIANTLYHPSGTQIITDDDGAVGLTNVSLHSINFDNVANNAISGDKIHGGTISGSLLHTDVTFADVNSSIANDSISGDKIHGGTISGFQSTGITDNANSTALTISSDEGGYHNVSLTNIRKMEMIGPNASLHMQGTSSGYVEGSVCFLNSQPSSSTKRGAGIFSYTEDNGTNIEWFLGRPYSSNDNIVFARRVITDPSTIYGETAQLTHALVKIDSGGFVTAGNTQREGYFTPSTSGTTKISQWCKLATLRHRMPYMMTIYITGGSYSPGSKTVIFQKSYTNNIYATTLATFSDGSMFTQIRSNSTSTGSGTYDLEVYAINLWNSSGGVRQGFNFLIQPLHNAYNINNDVIIIGSGDNPSSLGYLATVTI